eukprot:CAMPEP_0180252868 /NCGR_PEP_ID=MMETSP0987-20121128/39281_1 /TAXON_ID=697907 /ORGANISM="non described non described, Strain CCMP2293" /LENGTH=162 /DNA_ID=CAMNT_0022221667 /DNA_START=211 /DNA_END=696 /DNA_ORIENTATION=+
MRTPQTGVHRLAWGPSFGGCWRASAADPVPGSSAPAPQASAPLPYLSARAGWQAQARREWRGRSFRGATCRAPATGERARTAPLPRTGEAPPGGEMDEAPEDEGDRDERPGGRSPEAQRPPREQLRDDAEKVGDEDLHQQRPREPHDGASNDEDDRKHEPSH